MGSNPTTPTTTFRRAWVVAFALLLCACGQGGASRSLPSVLLITLDTTRADRLGSYGHPGNLTPHLDRLASMGTLFSHAVAQAAVTPVSHASILTGRNPYSHGLRVLHGLTQNRLADSQLTLTEILGSAGYDTAAFVSAFPVTERFGLHQGFDTFDAEFLEGGAEGLVSEQGDVNTGRSQRLGGETTDRALAWLARGREPYFLWLHYFDPHDAMLRPPKEFRERHGRPAAAARGALAKRKAVYDLEIRYMDAEIGRLLQALDDAGQLRELIIVVIGDHGEGLGDHDWWTHGILYQEQIQLPFLVVAPQAPGPRRVPHLVRSIDVAPTILELVGLDPERLQPMEGVSLVPLLMGDAPDPELVAYSDSVNTTTYRVNPEIEEKKDDMLFAVVQGPWKYIHHLAREDESELYNLEEDPQESRNLLESHPRERQRMHALLMSLDFLPEAPPRAEHSDPELLERLRALGYLSPAP